MGEANRIYIFTIIFLLIYLLIYLRYYLISRNMRSISGSIFIKTILRTGIFLLFLSLLFQSKPKKNISQTGYSFELRLSDRDQPQVLERMKENMSRFIYNHAQEGQNFQLIAQDAQGHYKLIPWTNAERFQALLDQQDIAQLPLIPVPLSEWKGQGMHFQPRQLEQRLEQENQAYWDLILRSLDLKEFKNFKTIAIVLIFSLISIDFLYTKRMLKF